MQIYGSIMQNLNGALESSRRLKGHPIHKDTLRYWADLLNLIRARRAAGEELDNPEIERSMAELEAVVAQVDA